MIALPILFCLGAMLYATAGFGGASFYLSVLTLAGLPFGDIPAVALLCNIVVVSCGMERYTGGGHFRFSLIWPFIIGSVPASYLGGLVQVSRGAFSLLLGLSLVFAALAMFMSHFRRKSGESVQGDIKPAVGIAAGVLMGLVAGLTGIGGGIFLTPLLTFMRAGSSKQIAAASAFFILINSISGLVARFPQLMAVPLSPLLVESVAGAALGGIIGSHLGAVHWQQRVVALTAAGIVLWGGVRQLLSALL